MAAPPDLTIDDAVDWPTVDWPAVDWPAWLPQPELRRFIKSGDLQTLAIRVHRVPDDLDAFGLTRLTFPIDDGSGDQFVGYWVGTPPEQPDPKSPVIVLLHGLGGDALSSYMTPTARILVEAGYDVFLANFRGAGESGPLCRRLHHPGRTDDLRSLLTSLRNAQPQRVDDRDLMLIAFSLGGHLLLKFLEEDVSDLGIIQAVSVSAPLELAVTSRTLTRWDNWAYDTYLVYKIKQEILRENANITEEERRRIGAADSVWALDDSFTSRHFGYGGAEEFYAAMSALDELPNINVPTVLFQAEDDPFVPVQTYRDFDWSTNSHLCPIITRDGGHAGFFTHMLRRRWVDEAIVACAQQLEA